MTEGFNLTLSSSDSGTTIIYTLDGSEPDENNLNGTTYRYKNQYPKLPTQSKGSFLQKNFTSLEYSAPIAIVDRTLQPNKISTISSTYDYTPPYFPKNLIYKGTVVKAKVIKSGALSSEVITKNYFISPQGNNRFTLPVVSLSIDENKLFDYTNGIFVAGKDFDDWRDINPSVVPDYEIGNFARKGVNYERIANLNYFVNGVEVINQNIGIRIHGNYSRTYPNKSLNIYARSDYGIDKMNYKFFSDQDYTNYERVTLKNFGGDFYNTLFRDALNFELVKSLRLETEAYQPVIEFINGEYYGLLGMREHYDNNYFNQTYGIAPNAVDLLENDGSTAEIQEGDNVDYLNLINYVQNNSLSNDTNYNYIKTRLDPENFTDYFVSNIFFQNVDWPGNNIVYWRKKTTAYVPDAPYGHDGRWRWAIHDMDSTFRDATHNSLADATATNGPLWPNPAWSTLLLRKLLENNTFKIDFINRFADLLNTSFLSSRITTTIDAMKAVIAPEIIEQIARWNAPVDTNDWNFFISAEKKFANARPSLQRDHIRLKFGITSNINATLNVSGSTHGYIKMNTITIIDGTPGVTGNPYPWTGIYFKDIPIKLKAIANPGFVFSNWTGASTSTSDEITITPTENFSITANFIPSGFIETSVPIYFWMMNSTIVNGAQLTSLNSTYRVGTEGQIQYQSCIVGYPFSSGPNNSKASMERRNLPTNINYRPEANNNIVYSSSIMKGLQIKEPLQTNGLENTMVFTVSTAGYKKIKFSFAAINELTNADAISIDYAINSGSPIWITNGLASTSLALTSAYQLFQTDFSAITTADNNPDFKIRLRFTGTNMTTDTGTGTRITFNNIALDGVKIPLSYISPNIFTVGTTIPNLVPSASQTITSYSVSPVLPAGLTLNTTTGIISGSPTAIYPAGNYTITAANSGGSTTFDLQITVNDIAPNSLSYASPNVFTVGNSIPNLSPTVTGGTVLNYSISPNLPDGLTLNTTTGIISGSPTAISPTTIYSITATNSGGSTTFDLQITVNDIAPNSLSYASPNVFTVGNSIPNLSPTVAGGMVLIYSISPNLPDGLTLNTETGIISGIPTVVSETKTYTVTALNSGGSAVFNIIIKVEIPLNIYENDFSNIKIYPNPFNDVIYFYGLNSPILYKMYAIEGKLIQEGAVIISQIEFCDLPTGIYFIILFSEGKMATRKLLNSKK
jgi:uncharacterized repeat protein (TIGR02543 family)